jgi:hypothetical protein
MPLQFELDGGTVIEASEYQQILLQWWSEAWTDMYEKTGGEALVVLNGDLVEGVNGKNRHFLTTSNETDMRGIAYDLIKPIVDRYTKVVIVRGTFFHGGTHEEAIARALKCEKDKMGRASRYCVRFHMNNNAFIDVKHHGSISMPHLSGNMLKREWTHCVIERVRAGLEPPNMVVRSHGHKWDGLLETHALVDSASIMTPAWCLLNDYAYKVVSARNAVSDIGLIRLYVENDMVQIDKDNTWVIDPVEEEV